MYVSITGPHIVMAQLVHSNQAKENVITLRPFRENDFFFPFSEGQNQFLNAGKILIIHIR